MSNGVSASPFLLEVASYLEANEQDILFRWVQLASRLPAHFRRPDEGLKALIDHIPHVLALLRRGLVQPFGHAEAVTPPDAAEIHAIARYSQGMSARTVVEEYHLLRREIWATLRAWPRAQQLSAMDVFLLEERLNVMLDDIVSGALDTFVDLETEGGNGDAEAADHSGR